MKDYQTFLRESLETSSLKLTVGNYSIDIDLAADFWFQQTVKVPEYKKFLEDAKNCKESEIPAMVEKAQELQLFQTSPSNVWDMSRIMNTEKVRTDKECYEWKKMYIVSMLELYLDWAKNKLE